MLWLQRPPYLRWVAAFLLVAGAVTVDLTGKATRPHPFTAHAVTEGAPITAADIELRPVPLDLFVLPTLDGAIAAHDIGAGEPILSSTVATRAPIPAGWWSVPMVLPQGVTPGVRVRLVGPDAAVDVEGIVVSVTEGGAFAGGLTGLVAVAEQAAPVIAAAAANGDLTVLFAP